MDDEYPKDVTIRVRNGFAEHIIAYVSALSTAQASAMLSALMGDPRAALADTGEAPQKKRWEN